MLSVSVALDVDVATTETTDVGVVVAMTVFWVSKQVQTDPTKVLAWEITLLRMEEHLELAGGVGAGALRLRMATVVNVDDIVSVSVRVSVSCDYISIEEFQSHKRCILGLDGIENEGVHDNRWEKLQGKSW